MSLKVAVPGDPAANVIKRYGQSWASAHNAQLEILRGAASDGPGSRDGVDIWIVPTVSLPRYVVAGQLLPVPESITERNNSYLWQNVLPIYRHKLLTWEGKAYALPLLGDALVCYYRQDWFRDAGKAFDGRPDAALETWDDFLRLAELMQTVHAGAPSLPPLPESDRDLNTLFYSLAASYDRRAVREDEPKKPNDVELFSFHYDLETMKPRLNAPAFVHALGLLQKIQKCRPKGTAAQPAEAFRDGKAAFCIAGPEWIERFSKEDSKVRGKFAIARVPGSASYFDYTTGKSVPAAGNYIPYLPADGWIGVVPKSAPHPNEAFELLAHLSQPSTSAEIVSEPAWGGGPYRREHLTSAGPWETFGLDADGTKSLLDALRAELTPRAINPAVALRTPDAAEHEKIVAEEVRAALSGSTEPAAALAKVVKRWEELDAGKELATRRKEYRYSLGLTK